MTQLGAALRQAGYGTSEERLRDIAAEVLGVHPDPNSAAAQEALYARVLSHKDLLCLLFAPWREAALKRCLVLTEQQIAAAAPKRPKVPRTSPPAPPRSPASPPHFSELVDAKRLTPASVQLIRAEAQRARDEAQRAGMREAQASVAPVLAMSMLDQFKPDGYRSIGDYHAGEARAWAVRTGQQVRWVTLLTANMPHDWRIRDHVKPEQANAFWQQVAKEIANAA